MGRVVRIVLLALALAGCRERTPGPHGPDAPVGPRPSTSPTPPPITSSSAGAASVRVSATSPLGVPLHASPGESSVSGRLPDGTEVVVLERAPDGRWVRVRAPDGTIGWLTRRYLTGGGGRPDAGAAAGDGPEAETAAVDTLLPAGSIWRSRADCERALGAGKRWPRAASVARLASWNVRWFPDGKPGKGGESEHATDVAWLACALAWLDADVVAVQEFKAGTHARERSAELVRLLNQHTGGRWRLELDRCPNADAQHVGLLFDEKRVSARGFAMLPQLNPHGEACKDLLRPGFGGYFRFSGGLDLHLVSVHSKSGTQRRSLDLRDKSLRALDAAHRELMKAERDTDVVLAGDFNTMGCKECAPKISASDELESASKVLAGLAVPYRRVPAEQPCSEYHDQHATLLDHFVVSRSLAELPATARATVSGVCGESVCRTTRETPAAVARLSDHCPLLLEIADRDQD